MTPPDSDTFREVFPHGDGSGESPYRGTASRHIPGRPRAQGAAAAALVFGIVALALSPVPVLNNAGYLAGLVAVTTGVIGFIRAGQRIPSITVSGTGDPLNPYIIDTCAASSAATATGASARARRVMAAAGAGLGVLGLAVTIVLQIQWAT